MKVFISLIFRSLFSRKVLKLEQRSEVESGQNEEEVKISTYGEIEHRIVEKMGYFNWF